MNRRTRARRTAVGRSAGFTLVELLVVVAIIAILMGIVLAALAATRASARVERTRATIEKLHNIILPLYEDYRYRRVPLSESDVKNIFNTPALRPYWDPDNRFAALPQMSAKAAAMIRLTALRDLMRMEMPERPQDVSLLPLYGTYLPEPSVHQAYRNRTNNGARLDKYASAECLYLIVTLLGGEDARVQFRDDEVADSDGNGLPEFIDGWGNPIKYLRWAPAFNDSEIQLNAPVTETAAADDPDPLDTRKADFQPGKRWTWRLVPLIFSAGPDGIYDINMMRDVEFRGDPYRVWDGKQLIPSRVGEPVDSANDSVTASGPASGGLDHTDNIHNHRLSR